MIDLKINGYNLYKTTGIAIVADKQSLSSFEAPNDVLPVYSHTWPNGIIEYDLSATVNVVPRVFTIRGRIIAKGTTEYSLYKQALWQLVYQNYVTIEIPALGVQVNAKIKGSINWNRISSVSEFKQRVDVELQFDEVMQNAPFKFNGSDKYNIYYGPSAAIPTNPAQVLALSKDVNSISGITFGTGTTQRVFNVVIKSDKSIINITDLDTSVAGDVTQLFTPLSIITIEGVNYQIYSMVTGAPYLTNHFFKIFTS